MYPVITRIKEILLLIVFVLLVISCEQVIKVSLRNEQPNVVIEGYITDGNGPFTIMLSESQNYYDQSPFKGIENAQVRIGNSVATENLTDQGSGIYNTGSRFRGVAGNSYNLNVDISGKTFNASVVLPPPVPIDTAYFLPNIFQPDSFNVYIEFNDPFLEENYYRLKIFRNGFYDPKDYILVSDAAGDGQRLLVQFSEREFARGDNITIEMDNVEHNTWLYFKGVSEIISNGFNAQSPGNPPSNISGGALGYFGAWGTARYNLNIPD